MHPLGRARQTFKLVVGSQKYYGAGEASLATATAFLEALDGSSSVGTILRRLYGSPSPDEERDAVLALDALRLAGSVSFERDA